MEGRKGEAAGDQKVEGRGLKRRPEMGGLRQEDLAGRAGSPPLRTFWKVQSFKGRLYMAHKATSNNSLFRPGTAGEG